MNTHEAQVLKKTEWVSLNVGLALDVDLDGLIRFIREQEEQSKAEWLDSGPQRDFKLSIRNQAFNQPD